MKPSYILRHVSGLLKRHMPSEVDNREDARYYLGAVDAIAWMLALEKTCHFDGLIELLERKEKDDAERN